MVGGQGQPGAYVSLHRAVILVSPVEQRGDSPPGTHLDQIRRASNLTMRMNMRRFTRLTNGSCEKVENHNAAVSLHWMHYAFARPHRSLGKNVTPAMPAGVSDHVRTCEEIAALCGETIAVGCKPWQASWGFSPRSHGSHSLPRSSSQGGGSRQWCMRGTDGAAPGSENATTRKSFR
jgi:hypothetical protein